MKGQYYNFLVYRLLGLLMALNVINLSVGVRNTVLLIKHTVAFHENLSANGLGSISEFLLEECFGFCDAVPNQDGPDDESELTELELDYDFNSAYIFAPLLAPVQFLMAGSVPFRPESIPVHIQEVFAPPPQILV